MTYRVLDEAGNKVGTPIKASAFYMKPTLKNLEKKFAENESQRVRFKKRLQTNISWILNKQPATIEAFTKALERELISTVVRKGKGNVIYGITNIDNKSKSVFNGSDLGKEYSAKAILEKCRQSEELKFELSQNKQLKLRQNEIPKHIVKMDSPQSSVCIWPFNASTILMW